MYFSAILGLSNISLISDLYLLKRHNGYVIVFENDNKKRKGKQQLVDKRFLQRC